MQGHDTRETDRPPDPGALWKIWPCPRRHRGPLLLRPGSQIPPYHDWQDHALAGSGAHRGHDGRHCPASIPRKLGFAFRNLAHCHFGPRRPIHLGGVEDIPGPTRHQRLCHNRIPPAGQRHRGRLPPNVKERPSLRRLHEQIVDAIAPLGDAQPAQHPQAQHGDLHSGGSFRYPTACPWPLLPGRTIALALRRRTTWAS